MPFILFAIFLSPGHRFGIFFLVINAFGHAADYFCQIDRFITHTQIFLEEVRIYNRAGNTHRNTTHRKVRLPTHRSYSLSSTGKTQNFFCHIRRNRVIIQVLYIATVNTKCRQPLLCMSCQHSSQIHRSRALRPIESPNSFRIIWIHIHCLSPITPT